MVLKLVNLSQTIRVNMIVKRMLVWMNLKTSLIAILKCIGMLLSQRVEVLFLTEMIIRFVACTLI